MDEVQRTWKRGGGRRPADVRFWEKVNKNGPVPEYAPHLGPCWIWTASVDLFGYGQFGTGVGKATMKAYRWAWEEANGRKRADGMHLDHLCRVPRCVRPSHLEEVTPRTNYLRSSGVSARAAAATHCPAGHPYDEPNTYVDPAGHRHCRACGVEVDRRYYARTQTPERIAARNARARARYAARRAARDTPTTD